MANKANDFRFDNVTKIHWLKSLQWKTIVAAVVELFIFDAFHNYNKILLPCAQI